MDSYEVLSENYDKLKIQFDTNKLMKNTYLEYMMLGYDKLCRELTEANLKVYELKKLSKENI